LAVDWRKGLEELAGEAKAVSASRVAVLSDLAHSDVDAFRRMWQAIKAERRRHIVSRMVELAEDNVELNFDTVFRMCLEDPDGTVRLKAIEGVEESDEPYLIEPLLRVLHQDAEEGVRARAAVALGRFTLLAVLKKLRPRYAERLETALLEVLNDGDQPLGVRRRVVEAISPLSSPQVTQLLQEAYSSQHQAMRASALYAMGRNCDLRWLPVLVKELSSPEAELRYEAATACGELGEADVVPQLVALTRDPEPQVQEAALAALGKIGTSEAKRVLRESLQGGDERLRDAAAEALREADTDEPFTLYE
jgi:HEAT repeat protein